MTKIKQAIATCTFIGFLLLGCKKEYVAPFNSSASIYFTATSPVSSVQTDSTAIGFGYSPATVTDSIVKIPVSILGLIASRDRVYKVIVDSLSTAIAGLHYDLPLNPAIRTGRSVDSLSIVFHRTPDLLTNSVTLILHLEPNENFNTNMKNDTLDALTGTVADYTTYKISVVDGIVMPTIWNRLPRFYFGAFSVKKIKLLNTVTGMPLDALNTYATSTYWQFWGTVMNRYLLDQTAAGNAILEDNGTPMTMGPVITG